MSQKKTLSKYTKYVMWGTVALIPPAAFFYLLEFYTHNPFAEVRPWAQLFNIVLFELLAGIFLCITGRLRTAYRIEGTAALVFGLAMPMWCVSAPTRWYRGTFCPGGRR